MKKSLTYAQKHEQIKKEAKWTFALFLFCFLWWVITGWGLNTIDIYFYHLPLWWWLSCVGLYIIGSLGCIWLVKTKFVDFDLDDDDVSLEDVLSEETLLDGRAANTISPTVILPDAILLENRTNELVDKILMASPNIPSSQNSPNR